MDNNQPIQNDNQATGTPSSPDINNAAPQANVLPTNTRPNNMPAQAPQAPAKPQNQPNPNQQPANPNQTAALTPTQAQPAPVHKSLFDRIFTGLGGGPRYVTKPDPTDPTKAVTTEVPTSRGDITKSLLAGVIHGIISGAQAGANAPNDKYTDADGRVHEAPSRVNSNMAALGAGFNAGKQNQQQFKNAPQQAYDIGQQRKATVLSNNVNELRNQMMADKLHADDWGMKEDYYTKTQDIYKPIIDNITQASNDSGTQLVAASGLGHDDAMKQVQANPSGLSAVQDGWTTETHGDGRTYHVPTFSLVKIGDVPVSRDALSALAPYNSAVQKLLDSTSGNSTLSTSMLLSLEKQATAANGAHTFLNQLQDGMGVPQMSQADFNEKVRSSPQLQRNVNDIATVLGNVGTVSSAHALAQLQQSGKAGEFFKLLGKSPDQIQDYIEGKENEEIAAATKAKNIKAMADPAVVANFAKDAKTNYPNLTAGQIVSVVTGLGKKPSQADLDKAENKLQSISNSNHQAKLADQGLDEKQQKMLFDYGVVGTTRLSLDSAPDEMLVNQRTGNPIPNKSLSAVKPSQSEINRAQFADSTLHLVETLKKLQDAGNLPNTPLIGGVTRSLLSKAGVQGAEAQKAMTDISLLQSAATGAHVGGRFSTQVLDKMNKLLSLNMNDAQFRGSLDAIADTMQNYKDNGGRFTVAEWRQLTPQDKQRLTGGETNQVTQSQRPAPPAGFAPVVPAQQ